MRGRLGGAVAMTMLGALAGADTWAAAEDPAFSISRAPEDRTHVVAGCVPLKFKLRLMGSVWVACNDPNSELAVDKLVETPMVSCLDTSPNGVLRGFYIDEVNNRSWQSFRFSCADLQRSGSVAGTPRKSDDLFTYSGSPKHYETVVPDASSLAFGILEIFNELQLRESLLSVGLEHVDASTLFAAGQANRLPESNVQVTPRVPAAHPAISAMQPWTCPPGTVLTGASVGHIPQGDGKWTRPVFIDMECSKLLAGNPGAVKPPPPASPLALGAACSLDRQCRSERCVAGRCVCRRDEDCDDGFWCNAGFDVHENACARKLDSGEICGTVGELSVGHRCRSGDCKASGIKNLRCR